MNKLKLLPLAIVPLIAFGVAHADTTTSTVVLPDNPPATTLTQPQEPVIAPTPETQPDPVVAPTPTEPTTPVASDPTTTDPVPDPTPDPTPVVDPLPDPTPTPVAQPPAVTKPTCETQHNSPENTTQVCVLPY